MPCERVQDELDQMVEPDPKLWTKRPRVNVHEEQFGHEMLERAEVEEEEDEGNEEKRSKWNGRTEYVTIKSWVTGDCAEMKDSDIKNELHNLAREYGEKQT